MKNKRVLIIIPAYNEEKSIDKVINKIESNSNNLPYQIDYIVVNDCSRDGTLNLLRKEDRNYISLPINLGIGGGMQCGYMYALSQNYDVAVQMDGDGQHDCNYLDKIVSPVLEGKADIVIGSRFIEKSGFQSSTARRFGIRLLSSLIRIICGATVKDVTSGFRAANKHVIKLFSEDYAQDYPEPESIVQCTKKKLRICEVPVVMQERQSGKSSISGLKSVYYMVKVSIAIVFAAIS